jgi:hypothetical protein
MQDEKVEAIALHSMQDVGRKSGLRGIEIIDGIVLAEGPWTPENVSFPFSTLIITGTFSPFRLPFF